MFRFESRKCPVCREKTKMIVQVRRGETDQIPDTGSAKRPVCYKVGNPRTCYIHSSSKNKL